MRQRSQSISQPTNLYTLLLKELNLHKASSPSPPLIPPLESFEQITNMFILPFHLEKFMLFGLLTCFNSFLKLLVILPLRFFIDVYKVINLIRVQFIPRANHNHSQSPNTKNLLFVLLLAIAILLGNVDTSRIYHKIRVQSSIKLYVMFGVLEISDKLLSTLGQDLLNYLNNKQLNNFYDLFHYSLFYLLSILYLAGHSVVLIYQTIALTVAANSYSNSLVTLLLSNQFAEIKSNVFKRLDREGLFQMSCSDIVERFQLLTMLTIISLKNVVQIGKNDSIGLLPSSSFNSFNKIIGVIAGPTLIVIGSELVVDWVKHSYITKFNKIRPHIYDRFLNILSSDVIDNFKTPSLNTNSINNDDKIQQRLGLPTPALFVLFVIMSKQCFTWVLYQDDELIITNVIILVISYIVLLLFKLILQLVLLKWSNEILKESINYKEDYVPGLISNGFGIIDEDNREKLYSFENDDKLPENPVEIRKRKDSKSCLNKVTRYRMSSKRIY